MRKYPKHFNTYLLLCQDLGLSCPKGRALYACNRIQNGDWHYPCDTRSHEKEFYYTTDDCVKRLRGVKLETAQRWVKHWKEGGSVKTISRSREEQLQYEAGREARLAEYRAEFEERQRLETIAAMRMRWEV